MTADDGMYEVLVVRFGSTTALRSELFLHYAAYGEPDSAQSLEYYFWVARNAHRTVVIDTGYQAAQGEARGRRTLLDPAAALAEYAADATDVVLTHLHYDHVGNLDALPAARVHLAAAEYDFWAGDLGTRRLFGMTADDRGTADVDRARADGRLVTFDERHRVAPGIEVIRVGGHTPGQSIVIVDTAGGRVLLASDAVHLDEELDRDRPFWICADLPQMYEALDFIRGLRDSGAVRLVLAGHQPGIVERFSTVPGANVAIIGEAA